MTDGTILFAMIVGVLILYSVVLCFVIAADNKGHKVPKAYSNLKITFSTKPEQGSLVQKGKPDD